MAEKYGPSPSDHYSTYGNRDNLKRRFTSLEYDSNDDYSSCADKNIKDEPQHQPDEENEESKDSQKAVEYVRALIAEKILIDQVKMPNAARLIDAEIAKVQQMGRPSPKEFKYVDIYREKPIKVVVKVLVPVREHPRFNFMGKILGPKGNTLKQLQEETMCRITILGRGSKKDRAEEEALRLSLDPKFAHLTDDLHVEISALAAPAEAHARVAFALAEVKKYIMPENNDLIRQQQLREMRYLTGPSTGEEEDFQRPIPKPSFSRPTGPPMRMVSSRPPVLPSRPIMPAQTKTMSILNRAGIAIKENRGHDDDYEPSAYVPPHRPLLGFTPKYSYRDDYRQSSSSYNKYAEPASMPNHWKPKSAPSSSFFAGEGRYRASTFTRPSKEMEYL